MRRKLWMVLLTLAVMLCVSTPVRAAKVIASGNCGADGAKVTYTLTDKGVLKISGKGKIADKAFYEDSKIKSVKIKEGVTGIGKSAFAYCTSIESVSIPESVTGIGECAFDNCEKLKSMYIPGGVTSIGKCALEGCDSLKSIAVSADNKKYDSRNNCNAIIKTATNTLIIGSKNTVIPKGVTKIGDNAFSECDSLKSIDIPDSVTSIGDNAFDCCHYLRSVSIPDSVTKIGDSAFDCCMSLKSLNLPDHLVSIGDEAFSTCDGLISINIPKSVTRIGNNAFSYCDLDSITVSKGNKIYDSRNDCNAIIETASDTLLTGSNHTVIPDDIAAIGSHAFSECRDLTEIRIPASVNRIGDAAFTECYALTSIDIPDNVTCINEYMFSDCDNLVHIGIPDHVTSIGDAAFDGCSSLASIDIPKSVTSIGDSAFYNCTSLISICIPYGVTHIDNNTFYGCSGLTRIDIPYSVTKIGLYAFYGCSSLKNVYYSRTKSNWKQISIDETSDGNEALQKATIHYVLSAFDCENNPTVSLSALSAGKYLRADISDFDCGIPSCDSSQIQLWEEFELIRCSDGAYALRSCANRKYLSLYSFMDVLGVIHYYARFCMDEIDDSCKLKFESVGQDDSGQDIYAIRFICEKKYLTGSTSSRVISKRSSAERFLIILRDNNSYTKKEKSVLAGIGSYWTIQNEIGSGSTKTMKSLGYKTMYYKEGADSEKNSGTIKIDNMECAIGVKKTGDSYEVLITFQGTGGYGDDQWDDCWSNLGGGVFDGIKSECHSGYWNMMEKLSDNQYKILCSGYGGITLNDLVDSSRYKEGTVHFTILGHSMGGAIAQCYAKYLSDNGTAKSDISGRTFNSALATTFDDTGYKDWYNICVSSDTVCNGLVPGTVINDYGMHRIGQTIWLYDTEPDKNTELTLLGNIATAKHNMDCKLKELLEKYTCYWKDAGDSAHSYQKTGVTKATLTGNGKIKYACSKCGKTKSTKIYAVKSVTLSENSYTYNGKAKKPTVTVLDSKGKVVSASNYSLTYASGRKNVGSYAVEVTFCGNYEGTKILTFTIRPAGTAIRSLTAVSKGFTVKWDKQTTQTSGYQIRYSLKSDMSDSETVTVSSSGSVSKKITGLKAKKTYYVQIRTYGKVGASEEYYSDWSSKKSVTVK